MVQLLGKKPDHERVKLLAVLFIFLPFSPELSSDHGDSPHSSPARSKKFNLFKKKEKKDKKPRTMSLQECDVQFIDDKNKDSSHGLVVTFATKSKGTSAEDVSGVHISPSSEQLSFLQKGQPPPRKFLYDIDLILYHAVLICEVILFLHKSE